MRTVVILIVLSSVGSLPSQGQSTPINESPPSTRTYHLPSRGRRLEFPRRFSETGFVGSDQIHSSAIRPERLVPIHGGRSSRDLGTDWKRQLGPFMNGYFNERYMFYFDVRYGKHFRSFVELKSGLNSYRVGGPGPIDEKKLDFQAAFPEVGTGDDRNCGPVACDCNLGRVRCRVISHRAHAR
jgi:hypothetical protein